MTEQKQQEPVVIVVQNDTPTTKQELKSAAIQLGAALALPVLLAGSYAAVSVAKGVKAKAKAKLSRKKPDLTVVPDSVED